MKNIVNEMKNTLEGIDSRLMMQKNRSTIWKTEWWTSPKLNSKKEKELLKMRMV